MRIISPCCGEVAFGLRYPISKPYQEVLSQLLLSLVGTGKVGGSLLAISKSLQTQKIMSSTQQNINNRYSDCSETAVGSMWCASQRSTRSKCSITTDNAQMNTETEPCNRDTRITELTIGPLVDNTSPSSQLLEDIASAVENALDSDDDSDVDEENDGKHQNVRLPITNRHFDCATEIVARVTRRYHEDCIYLDTWKMSTATAEQVDGTVVNLYDRVPSVVVEIPPWIVARQRPRKRRNPWRPRRTRFLPPMTMFSHRFQLTESLSSSSSSDEEKRLLNEKPISDEYVDDNDDGEWQVYDERLWLAADNDMPLPPTENTEPEVWEFYDERLWENIVPTFVEEEVTQDTVLIHEQLKNVGTFCRHWEGGFGVSAECCVVAVVSGVPNHGFQLTESLSSSSDEEKRQLNESLYQMNYVDDNDDDDDDWQMYDERLWMAADNDMPPTEKSEPEVWKFYKRLWESNEEIQVTLNQPSLDEEIKQFPDQLRTAGTSFVTRKEDSECRENFAVSGVSN
ncbi:Uncharacterized protein FWK35_00021024 [Aphis craccivora]|uniref:Uncharacterized protein n=1 Tax=Aphis craccivora TaxID=307492 RepID=A0A6G0YA90_APHCR|nr:Uncharacterized protein FWK35_00021024 [Aphis craccivora]